MIILFEISSYEIVKTIRTENQIISIQKFDNGLIYIGDFSGGISQWELNGDNLKFIDQKKNAHSDKVTSILQFDNGIIVSGSNDNTIKIWK
jgi:WD40 repeat protein